MIYFVTKQQRNDLQEGISNATLSDLRDYINSMSELGLDLETEGFDPYTQKPICWQVGDKKTQFVVEYAYYDLRTCKDLLQDESKLFLGHNLKFDLRFLLHQGIILNNVYDTYISEQILWNGYDYMRKSLDYVSDRYTGKFLDKSIRGNIHREGLTNRVIKYSAEDVEVLPKIKEKQLERAKKINVNNALDLNNKFVPVISYLEYCGFKLDTKLWQEKIDKDNKVLKEKIQELNKGIIDNNITEFVEKQLDLFDPSTKININWASPKQTSRFFQKIGIDTAILDKETGEIKDSVSADVLKKQINSHPLVEVYINYRELLKKVSTYGENWYKFINPVTGRIHTKFQQWMSTGRMSSGGKDKGTKIDYPNAQNIPSDKNTRKCIIAEEGNILVNADYDSQEVRVFANKCMDPALLKMFDDGYTDMHSYNAWHIFPELREKYPEMCVDTLKKINENFPDKRYTAKLGGFSMQYGGTGHTIAENCNIFKEEGEIVYNNYFESFQGIKKYFDSVYKNAKKKGYILFNSLTKSKYFIPRGLKDSKIKTRAYNFPVQGTSADITKLAGIYYWRSLVERGLVFKCKIAIICHDEYLLEVPKEIANQEAKILKECMEKAGDIFCKRIKLTATPVISSWWHH